MTKAHVTEKYLTSLPPDKDGLLGAAMQNYSCEFRNKLREKPFAAIASLLYDHIHNFNEAEVNAFSQITSWQGVGSDY